MKQIAVLVALLLLLEVASPLALKPLHLVALVPTGNENATRCVDRGEELVVAANMAAEAINNSSDILQGFKLEILVATSDNCTAESFSTAIVHFTESVLEQNNSVVGAIGMVCPSTVQHLSPFVSLPGISLVQMTAGTTPPSAITRSRDRVKLGHLYQTAPASTIYNDALIALAAEQNWTGIAVVRLTSGANIIHNNQVEDLREKISGTALNITFNGEVTTGEDASTIGLLLDEIERRRSRIIYATLPDLETRNFLCEAYLRNITSPLYTWVLHDHPLEGLTKSTDKCAEDTMAKALTGTILLHYSVPSDRNRTLKYLNLEYGEYERQYREKLRIQFGNDSRCANGHEIVYSNAMYDSVIAMALALNESQRSINLTAYGKGQPQYTKHIDNVLTNSTFEFDGAIGLVSFDESHQLETNQGVDIHQISDMTTLLPYAYYNGTPGGIRRLKNFNSKIRDRFENDIRQIHFALAVTILGIIGVLIAVSIVVLILFICHWNAPDIRATSPKLSIIILGACFLLYASATFTAVRNRFSSGDLFAIFCALEWWTFVISIQLIFSTLFMRLLRIYRIFFHYEKAGKPWSDGVVMVVIALMVALSIAFLVVWTTVDSLKTHEISVFVFSTSRPHFDTYLFCRSRYLGAWLGLIVGYSALVMIAVLVLAVMTRKIKIEIFRDTKEVNAFIFTTVFLIIVLISLSLILERETEISLYTTFILRELCLVLVAIACKVFLFVPKLYYAHFEDSARHKKSFETDGKRTGTGTRRTTRSIGTI